MTDQTSAHLTIDAEPAAIMAVIADFPDYPAWASAVKETEVVETDADGKPVKVRFVLDAGPIKDEYTLAYKWNDDRGVRWSLVESKSLKALDGSYHLKGLGSGSTEVTYRLAVDVSIPLIGLLKRKAEKVIIDTALKELKKRVESR